MVVSSWFQLCSANSLPGGSRGSGGVGSWPACWWSSSSVVLCLPSLPAPAGSGLETQLHNKRKWQLCVTISDNKVIHCACARCTSTNTRPHQLFGVTRRWFTKLHVHCKYKPPTGIGALALRVPAIQMFFWATHSPTFVWGPLRVQGQWLSWSGSWKWWGPPHGIAVACTPPPWTWRLPHAEE